MTHGLYSSVFFAWSEYVREELGRREQLLARTMGHALNRPLADAFLTRVNAVREAIAARERVKAHAIRHFRNHLVALAWDAWRAYVVWRSGLLRAPALPSRCSAAPSARGRRMF